MESILENLGAWLETLPEVGRGGGVLRYVVPLLAILIVARCAVSLLTFRREAEVWAWLTTQAGDRIPVTHWEICWGADGAAMCCSNIRRSHGRTRF